MEAAVLGWLAFEYVAGDDSSERGRGRARSRCWPVRLGEVWPERRGSAPVVRKINAEIVR